MAYADAGWYVGPVQPGAKRPAAELGTEWQRHTSRDPEVLASWFAGSAYGVFLHAGRSGAVVFDVDTPDRMHPDLGRAFQECQPPHQATRAGQPGRGHYVFAMPPGRDLGNGLGQLGGGWGEVRGRNGLIVVEPSVHPDGGCYQWLRTGLVPPLPSYVADLLPRPLDAAGTATDEAVAAFLAAHTAQERPELLELQVDAWLGKVAAGESRHDSMTGHLAGAMKEARAGLLSAQLAADTLQSVFLSAVTHDGTGRQGAARTPSQAADEWRGLLAWAVAQANASDPEEVQRRSQEALPQVVTLNAEQVHAGAEEEFWAAREALARVHTFARARRAAPWAVLGVVLARVVVATAPHVVLPPLVGGDASLNLFVGVVGASGGGKGAAQQVATAAVRLDRVITSHPVGSGEGLTHLFVRREKQEVKQHTDAVLATVAEVDTLTALASRQGSTIMPVLRQAYMGEEFGFGYADPAKRLLVEAHRYRLCMVIGIQPKRAAGLLDDADGGTPQRLLWLPALDPAAPDTPPDPPEPLRWEVPKLPRHDLDGRVRLPVCGTARTTVDAARLARVRGEQEALDGHALLTRLKVAAALGLLDRRVEVSEEDWELAGVVMGVSDRTRSQVLTELTQVQRQANHARGLAEAERVQVVEEHREERQVARVTRVARNLHRKLVAPMSGSALRRTLHERDRPLFNDALDVLLAQGEVVVEEVMADPERGGGPGRRISRTGNKK